MKIKNLIVGFLSVCIMFKWGVPTFSASSASRVKLPLPDDIVFDQDAINEKIYEFTLKDDGTYEISNYIYEPPKNGFLPGDSITLPSSYKGKPITSIGYRAFNTNNADHITGSLTIPSSIKSIGDYAFWLCNFKSCTIPSTVTSIGIGAFDDTPWLDNMRAQNPLVIVNNILIDAKTVKGDVVLPNELTAIPGFTFYKNKDLTGVTIPSSVKTIGESAFQYCDSLERINIHNGLTKIGDSAFGYCSKLSGTLTIPGSVKSIGKYCFNYAYALDSITIKNPKCVIYDDPATIYSIATIYGHTNSTAQNYAKKYNRQFKSIGDLPNLTGDFSGDGTIDFLDLVQLSKLLLPGAKVTNEYISLGDINGDGKLDFLDLVALSKELLKNAKK